MIIIHRHRINHQPGWMFCAMEEAPPLHRIATDCCPRPSNSTNWVRIGPSNPTVCLKNLWSPGSAYVMCNGEWFAYEDVTYVCRGEFTEDETEENAFGTFFSKVSQCSGAAAISPVITKLRGGIQYHGLSEFCNGRTSLQSSYALEELDHRYVAQTIDPRMAEQVICLMANRNCEQLRYMI